MKGTTPPGCGAVTRRQFLLRPECTLGRMKTMPIFEVLRVLGVLEVEQLTNL
jgi:hypothetical protein